MGSGITEPRTKVGLGQANNRHARIGLLIAAAILTSIAIYGSLVPLRFHPLDWQTAVTRFRQIPFLTLSFESRSDWMANILLFVPLGYFWLGALCDGRSRAIAAIWTLALVPALACLSVAIEFTQLWFPGRTASQNDMAAETIGGVIGATIWIGWGNPITKWMADYCGPRVPEGQIAWLLQAYLAGFILYSILPLDLTISLGELGRKYREGRLSLIPFVDLAGSFWTVGFRMGQNIVLAVPIGALASCVRNRTKEAGRSIVWEMLAGVGSIAGIELAQVFLFSRSASTTDVLLGGVGVAIGVGLYRCFSGHPVTSAPRRGFVGQVQAFVPLIIVAYAVLILIFAWIPFDFIRDAALIRERVKAFLNQVPGASLHAGNYFNAVDQVFKRFVMYAPLGYLLGLWSAGSGFSIMQRRFAVGFGLVSVAIVVLVGEIGQIFLVSRVADTTEILLCLVSAGIGTIVSVRLHAAESRIVVSSSSFVGRLGR